MGERKVRLERPADCKFDEVEAQRAVTFFNNHLRHTKGKFAGAPFNLRPWQEVDIREIYGRVDAEGNRLIRLVYKEIPKKNGKSEEAAGHALKLLFADDEPSAEVYGAAADKDQASIVFNVAAQMVRNNPRLSRRAKIIDSTKRIVLPGEDSFYRALSADVAGKHGFNTSGCIFDEIHAQRDRRLWEVLTFGAGDARTNPLTIGITTAGIPGESPVAEELHDLADQVLRGVTPCPSDFYPVMYAAPEDAPWDDEEVWHAVNPALGDFLNIASVRAACERARRMPNEQNSFRRLRLNQWVKTDVRAIDMADWDQCRGAVDIRELRHLTWYGGLDLSTKLDVTALVFVALDGNGIFWVLPYFFVPQDNLEDRPNLESEKYRTWSQQGLVTLTEGNVVDYATVRRKAIQVRDELRLHIAELSYDPWNATQLAQQLKADNFVMTECRQGYRTLSEPTKELLAAVVDHRVRHGGHPVLRWMADCLSLRQDENANVRPVKPDRMTTSKRIDGMVALIMAIYRAIAYEDNAISYSGLRVVG